MQTELFASYRYHSVFADNPRALVQTEKAHLAYLIIEQVHADLRSGSLAHVFSGSFAANSAWLVLSASPFNHPHRPGAWPRFSTPEPPPARSAPS